MLECGESVFDEAGLYGLILYGLIVDYSKPPISQLQPSDAAWADGRLTTAQTQ